MEKPQKKRFFKNTSFFFGERGRQVSAFLILIAVFLLPTFSLPGLTSGTISQETDKTLLVLLTVFTATFFFILSHRPAVIPLPRTDHRAAAAALILLITATLSTVFSEAPLVSFFGNFYEVGTLVFTAAAFILFALVATLFRAAVSAVFVLTTVVASFLLLVLAEAVRVLSAGARSVVQEMPLAGSPTDASVLVLFVGVVSVTMLALLRVRAIGRVVATLGLITTIGWGLVVGLPFGPSPENSVVTYREVVQLAQETLASERPIRALFGSGPLLFYHQKEQYLPHDVTQEKVEHGPSFFSTTLVTHGLLGLFSWLLFLGALMYSSIQAIGWSYGRGRVYRLSLFIPTCFLWGTLFFYYPGVVVFTLTALLSGLLFGTTLERKTDAPDVRVPRITRSALLISVALLLIFVIKDAIAMPLFARGEELYRNGAVEEGRAKMEQAASLSPRDTYHRTLGQFDYEKIKQMLPSSRERIAQFTEGADKHSGEALSLNPADYRNWHLFARAQALFAQLGVRGASIERVDEAYKEALSRNPYHPTLYLEHAYLLVFLIEDLTRATQAAQQALKLDPSLDEAKQLLENIERARQQN